METPTKEESLKDPIDAYLYAKDVLKGRFEEGEPIIATETYCAYDYAKNVLGGRFELGEPAIKKSGYCCYIYARDVLKKCWPEAEPIIAKDAEAAYGYAKDLIKGRFVEAEPIIKQGMNITAYLYAQNILVPCGLTYDEIMKAVGAAIDVKWAKERSGI